jgi:hypothetical protein
MIGGIRCNEVFELAVAPIVIATIHNDSADACAMTTDELGGAVGDDVRAPFKWAAEVGRGKCIVDKQDELVLPGDFSNLFKRENGQVRIT